LSEQYVEREKEKRVLSDLRMISFPHDQLHDMKSVRFYGEVDFNNLYRYSEGDMNDDFGLVCVVGSKRYQLSLPSGIVYRFRDSSSWDEWRTNHLPALQIISDDHLWLFIGSNLYQNMSTKQVRNVERRIMDVLTSSNWLKDFWVSNGLAGCFVTDTNSCRTFHSFGPSSTRNDQPSFFGLRQPENDRGEVSRQTDKTLQETPQGTPLGDIFKTPTSSSAKQLSE